MPLRSLIDFILLAAAWGASFMFMQIAVGDFGTLPTAAMRMGVAALSLLPLAILQGQMGTIRKHAGHLLVVGMFASGLPALLYSFAVTTIPTGLSALLNATTPMFGALVAWFWVKDRPDASRALGLLVGFAGVAWLAGDRSHLLPSASGIAPLWAVAACLLACLCYGVAASYTRRYLSGLSPLASATGSLLGASVVLGLPALAQVPARMPSPGAWAAVLALGVVCTGMAYVLYFRLIKQVGPARTLTVPYVIPVFAIFYGIVFLGETLTVRMVLGGLVIALGTALSTGMLRLRVGGHR